MRLGVFLFAAGLCSCASIKLPNSGTAAEQFAGLSGHSQRAIAKNFYELGSADEVKRLYWAQRRAQQYTGTVEASPVEKLERKYVVVPVPEHVDPDGTVKEASNQVVEVVHFVGMRRSHGRSIIIVK